MTVGDILVSINQASLDTMLPLTAVQTSADIERYYKEGYSIGITATEFAKKYPRLPITRIYAARKNLSRYIGYGQAGYVLQADEYYPSVDDGLIVLCSDGLSDFLSDTRICEILSTEENLEYAGRQLIDEAVAHPNSDNTTVMLIPLRK